VSRPREIVAEPVVRPSKPVAETAVAERIPEPAAAERAPEASTQPAKKGWWQRTFRSDS